MHWYDWHTVTERLQGRAYALTRGGPYRVILDPGTPTGVCDLADASESKARGSGRHQSDSAIRLNQHPPARQSIVDCLTGRLRSLRIRSSVL